MLNEKSLNGIVGGYEMKLWAVDLKKEKFSLKQVWITYEGDEKGVGMIPEFNKRVTETAEIFANKGIDFKGSVRFILEECAYVCSELRDVLVVYPTKFNSPIQFCMIHTTYRLVFLDTIFMTGWAQASTTD